MLLLSRYFNISVLNSFIGNGRGKCSLMLVTGLFTDFMYRSC